MFEAVERARVEAIGANRMDGMAGNLAAKCEDYFAHGRFANVSSREDAPLDEALALDRAREADRVAATGNCEGVGRRLEA